MNDLEDGLKYMQATAHESRNRDVWQLDGSREKMSRYLDQGYEYARRTYPELATAADNDETFARASLTQIAQSWAAGRDEAAQLAFIEIVRRENK